MIKDIYINDIYIPLLDNKKRYLVIYGGSGSGKSVFVAQKLIKRCLSEQNHRFLCVRKVANTLRNSVFQLLKDIIVDWGVYSEFVINKTEMRFTHLPTGNEIILTGLDDVERLKSITAITGIWVEEATDLSYDDLTQLSLRLRGETTNYKQIILSFNPIDESHWIKKEFFDNPSEDTTTLRTTYLDNEFIDEEYKNELNGRVRGNDNYYRIYVLGEWGKLVTGNEFYHNFTHKFVSKESLEIIPDASHHLSFDVNVLPYVSLICAQVVRKQNQNGRMIKQVRIYREYPMRPPDNSIKAACLAFKRDYEKYRPSVFYYGDASGKHRIPGYGNLRAFDDIGPMLLSFTHNGSDRVATRNPGIFKRRDFINNIFAGVYDIEILIDPSCKELIKDLEQVKTSMDGKVKDTKFDKVLGASYQQLTHMSDTFDYMICQMFYDFFN